MASFNAAGTQRLQRSRRDEPMDIAAARRWLNEPWTVTLTSRGYENEERRKPTVQILLRP